MTTAKDLFIIAMEPAARPSVGQGDLSLALAGAELIDLVDAGAAAVEGDRIVPGGAPPPAGGAIGEAAAGVRRQPPYERVEDWLWRRGRDLSAAYHDALERDGELTRKPAGRLRLGPDQAELTDTPARRQAAERWERQEPVLTALAAAVGLEAEVPEDEPAPADEAVTTVVAAVLDAVMELEAVRQRRSIEKAAFANVWRGP
ncbi:GPP34 family phosphoprotein [Streptomyces sp. NPDC089919]|uniref:GPP34 family phosphoprotein n=1 Tax=Streptomyces sp. NPDC089919 TaxID=3155188 RepID=UPI0034188E0A